MTKIWIVDDEKNILKMAQMMLSREGYSVDTFDSGMAAIEAIALQGQTGHGLDVDIVLTDYKLGDKTGLDILRAVKSIDATTQVILMTAFATTSTAVEAIKDGAFDYIEKPFKRDALLALIEKACQRRETTREKRVVQARNNTAVLSNFIGDAPPMRAVIDMITRVAPTRANILITGESGTGKEVVARALHQLSSVADKPFIPVNCGAIPETLVESEFFGYVKGAFTGATKDKNGFFAAANGGTLFLDEIGELPLPMQVKLLRAIQERKIQRVGDSVEKSVDVRIIAATNRDLRQEITNKNFREDLFFRLNVIQIALPPLRDRREDIPALLHFFITKYNREFHQNIRCASEEVLDCLINYNFPGNVRELENIIEHAMTLELSDQITLASLPQHVVGSTSAMRSSEKLLALYGLQPTPQSTPSTADNEIQTETNDISNFPTEIKLGDNGVELENVVEDLERRYIEQSLERTHGNVTKAAELLGISFRSMRYRLKKYGIETDK